MSLVNIGSIQKKALSALAKAAPGGGVELLSYKRNRSIAVILHENETFLVKERGYIEQEVVSHADELPRLLKGMIKREFPRSRKVRLVKFSDSSELDRQRQII